jgi:replicative DNA helicase
MFIHRPEYYDRDNPELEGKAKIIIAKQRNGPTEAVQLAFLKQFTRFDNLDKSYWMEDSGAGA